MTSPLPYSRNHPPPCSRRQFLRVAATAPFALNALLHGKAGAGSDRAAETAPPVPLIILFLSGGVSAKESFNPDPPGTAPELKGPLGTIPTHTPGVHFCEVFPELAKRSEHFALLRGLDSGSSEHLASMQSAVLSGERTVSERIGDRVADEGVPYVLLNPGSSWHGLYTAFRQRQAFVPLYDAQTRRFRPPQMPRIENMEEREELLQLFDTTPVHSAEAQRLQQFQQTALDLMQGGGQFFQALQLSKPDRHRFGNSLAGDMVLTAKQFIERGAGAVTIYHEPDASTWDMHTEVGMRMLRLGPEMDRAAAALIDEIAEQRLDCVLLMMGEMNRTPRINYQKGRDHWQYGNCAILCGGNTRAGVVHGRTNRHGEIIDGGAMQREVLPNTVLAACRQEIPPNLPRVRDVVR